MSCPLTSRPVYIGRAPTNDLVVGTPAVSSRHAAVWAQDRRVFVEDLGSRNGTWVDGRRVHKIRELRHGEEVLLGDAVRLRVEPVEGAPAPVVGWLIEELDGAIKLPVRTDRFRIGPHPGADLWVDDADGERTVLVDPDGAVWLGADDGSLAGVAAGEAFAVGSRRFRIVP
ncbi:MAG: FHA domain-containing protein, partial [Myxococcota bacterium]